MTEPAPAAPGLSARLTVEPYFALVDHRVLEENDRVELPAGVALPDVTVRVDDLLPPQA